MTTSRTLPLDEGLNRAVNEAVQRLGYQSFTTFARDALLEKMKRDLGWSRAEALAK